MNLFTLEDADYLSFNSNRVSATLFIGPAPQVIKISFGPNLSLI